MFIFFFYLATFLIQNKDHNIKSKNPRHRFIKATPITKVVIKGDLHVGEILTAEIEPPIQNVNITGIQYVWQIGRETGIIVPSSEEAKLLESIEWSTIESCTGKTCTIPEDAVGHKIRVIVTGDGEHYDESTFTSSEVGPILPKQSSEVIDSSEEEITSSSEEIQSSEEEIQSSSEEIPSSVPSELPSQTESPTSLPLATATPQPTVPGADCFAGNPFCQQCGNPISICIRCQGGYTLNNGKCIRDNKCDNVVTNCVKCFDDNPLSCEICEKDYGQYKGSCTYCPGNENPGDRCPPECSIIPNCDQCSYRYDTIVCNQCDKNYTTTEDGLSCVHVRDLPIDYCKNDYGEESSCLECDEEDHRKCKTCRPGFTFDEENKYCYCTHIVHGGRCYLENETSCDESVTNCNYCINSNQCIYCKDNYGVINGKCELIECKIENCDSCTAYNNEIVCGKCVSGYLASPDHKSCIKEENITCSIVPGCILCSNIDGLCTLCNSTDFEEEPVRLPGDEFYSCRCKGDNELVNGKCMEPIRPMTPPPMNEPFIPVQENMTTKLDDGRTQVIGSEENISAIYQMAVGSGINDVVVSENISTIIFKVTNNGEAKIDPLNKETDVTLELGGGESKLTIPPSSENIELKGSGEVVIKPLLKDGATEAKEVKIKKVVPQANSEMSFKSDVPNLILNEVQIFGETVLTGDSAEGHETKCQEILLEGSSILKPNHITLEKVKIGLKSLLNLEGDNNNQIDTRFDDNSRISIYYNRTVTERHFPIVIKNCFPDFGKVRLGVEKIAANIFLPSEQADEQLLIAQFTNDKATPDELILNCTDLAGKFDDQNDFGQATCINVTDADGVVKEVDLVAKRIDTDRDSDKKKLSGGAIAGIVIACIVVVAAIIALLVYFLVIKKRNQSTTSTQGDSSI
ncbi:hypothetical protein M9Y10_024334, partial [Tritrichomonas musculus]